MTRDVTNEKEALGFYDGVHACMTVLASMGAQTEAEAIANTVDREQLFATADAHDLGNLRKLGVPRSKRKPIARRSDSHPMTCTCHLCIIGA